MRWFRLAVAEIKKELEEPGYVKILTEISKRKGNPFQSPDWSDWLHCWKICEPNEKDTLLRRIFVLCKNKQNFENEWWSIWLLMFEDELFGLGAYYLRRVPEQNERWSIIIWSFFELLKRQKDGMAGELSIFGVCKMLKKSINRRIREERRNKGIEIKYPDEAMLSIMDKNRSDDIQEEESFATLRRNMNRFLDNLSEMDKRIIEEIYLFGNSGQDCADRLGISRYQVSRRLARVKFRVARFLNLPLLKKKGKPEKGLYGYCKHRKSDNSAW